MTTGTPILAIGGIPGGPELVLVVVVILILFFGARRLPELARSLGRSISEFRRGREEAGAEETEQKTDDSAPEDQNRQ
jgi:sec-independent protein translocase protein TatA